MLRDGQRVFVHAGLHPDRTLDEQDEDVCLWIRDRFLDADQSLHGLHVVHGHTPQWRGKTEAVKIERLAHRTNLDTGAYYTNRLTVGVFADDKPGGPVKVFQVKSDAGALPVERHGVAGMHARR
jgi:serine/threonine protein phosphatase 1